MAGDFTEYADCFPVGARVSIAIPIAGGGQFQDWALVNSLERDLLEVALSRDALPDGAHLARGSMVQVRRPEKDGMGRCCRGIVVGDGAEGALELRLVDGVVPFEPREYYRQDVYLPVEYRLPPTQQVSEVRERWRTRLRDQELAAQQPELGEPEEVARQREELRRRLAERAELPPAAANMSGGGVRIDIPERFIPGQLVELTFYIPEPHRVLELVGEVVTVQPSPVSESFRTALRYRFIEEADRDRVVGYVSREQLAQLARLGRGEAREKRVLTGRRFPRWLRPVLGLLLLAGLITHLALSIVAKRERGEKHEIEKIFEEGIARYLMQRR